jgi:hypothetical protein
MEFRPGFRLSMFDKIILFIGGGVAIYLATVEVTASFIVAFVVGHFFLFCNVFRISRPPELIWATIFVSASVMTITVGYPGWVVTTAISLVLAIAFIIREIRSPSYHGILWHRINPQLEKWWKTMMGSDLHI